MSMSKEFPHNVRVMMEGFKEYTGYSDLVETFCCSATPCYFVVFPEIGYEGYFVKYDVEVSKTKGGD